ncbi:bifunctional alpha/beta hydrolase/OsmC family protein [Pseudovibrio exalbescens]|uniref:bifunctional alpha/beta hydrolase/OsmC family protein n=1 Tax=Pseudovibrio exalbescens TaxID=197461 RepID=UPI0023661DB1|nr:bifunctional alpha/beta hydrolase/OsmC family protein [Pseudovibrio exalbescens]MDD7909125.1 bifunctional alpha/beta hydrolase/OsmC family protein [Pseudovibrio exalbescens]
MGVKPIKLSFKGSSGAELSARLDLPAGAVRAYALFAHCFTCSKDISAARRIAQALTNDGIAVLRFDFTGLGGSGGDFASSNFSSNLQDLLLAADYMRQNFEAPKLLVGHSLGGAAVLAVAKEIPEVTAVATIGAPSTADHVLHNFHVALDTIREHGEATVDLAGRPFKIKKQFVDDLEQQDVRGRIGELKKAVLVLHSPLDETVGIDNASEIFVAAKHPKSFVSLDNADHLLTKSEDADYAARVIAGWACRYIDDTTEKVVTDAPVNAVVEETGLGKFQNMVKVGPHRMIADEPESVGGLDSGPSPYDFVSVALASCTSMTLRIYAGFKKIDLGRVRVEVAHQKLPADHCGDCGAVAEGKTGKIDRFERTIHVEGELDEETKTKLLEIADKCPVHRTLESSAAVITKIAEPQSA